MNMVGLHYNQDKSQYLLHVDMAAVFFVPVFSEGVKVYQVSLLSLLCRRAFLIGNSAVCMWPSVCVG